MILITSPELTTVFNSRCIFFQLYQLYKMRSTQPVIKKRSKSITIILFLALSPLVPVILASIGGLCLSCQVNEAGSNNCIRWGIDFGETLSTMMMMGWLLIYTIPLGGISLLICQIYIDRKRSNKNITRKQQL